MKSLLLITAIGLLFVSNISIAKTVSISNLSCKYEITIPEGWDTIHRDTLKEKIQQMNVDLGIYPVSQEGYFNGNYAIVTFLPTANTLNKFAFKQIVSDITNMNKQSESSSDTLRVHYDKTISIQQEDNFAVQSYFSIRKDTISLENTQTLYLTKFGYISVLSYKKVNGLISLEDVNSQLSGMIQIQPDYQYSEPKKQGLTLKHILLSLGIGVFFYCAIAYFPQLKKRSK